ncbi:2-oxoglutarate/2-oxoacid ferredoxin oxidoreductase, beta subunit [hydrothermal vent metagenome]|uniref:2-oxoglutarate/2-oxoacid ferredoxin oxidoreductase, beta subunit n=1 Tax=hydrothermal vent metagenome TaxID=652676 RepID=A0A3B0R8H5_9ZZZZ
MTSFGKPLIRRKFEPTNDLGLTRADYEGAMSTLCAGCGHDSVTASMARAFFRLSIEPHRAVKVSGIGCSSKTTAYFLRESHGNNTVHGRMPSVATGAVAANSALAYIGVSGDGDSLSIGLGQFVHAMRRNVDMLYVLENNGVYGLTKGQFSASADLGSLAKRGAANEMPPIDSVSLALSVGATFVARGFSGDREQLVPLIEAGLKHKGFGLIDVISPCVSFNDHKGSTKSYEHTYKFYHKAVHADYVPPAKNIKVAYDAGEMMPVELHDGGIIRLRKLEHGFDPRDRAAAMSSLAAAQKNNEILTGLIHIDETLPDMHTLNKMEDRPLNQIPYAELNPGAAKLAELQKGFR